MNKMEKLHDCDTKGERKFFDEKGNYYPSSKIEGMSSKESTSFLNEIGSIGVCNTCSVCGREIPLSVW